MTDTTNLDASKVLNLAADYMDEHGWTRGEFNKRGRVCMVGALQAVPRWDEDLGIRARSLQWNEQWNLVREAQQMLEVYIIENYGAFETVEFNDEVCKSKEQAVRTLREAAKYAEESSA